MKFGLLVMMVSCAAAQVPKSVPTAAPEAAKVQKYRDAKYGVRFDVPPGWALNRKDGQVSTFRLDARTARRSNELRGVASLEFNPYPLSTLSGALVYYSVERHTNDRACEQEAVRPVGEGAVESVKKDVQSIGGMEFAHGHDEHGRICVEARDDVYTAYRKGVCYRFDLAVNTFCSITSGAEDLTVRQMHDVESRMVGILSTVVLDWEKSGAQVVPVPGDEEPDTRKPLVGAGGSVAAR